MKLKKILAFVLCGAITVGLLGGCSGSEDKKEEDGSKKEAKGGYVEKEIEGPWGEEEIYLGRLFKRGREAGSIYPDRRGRATGIFLYAARGRLGKNRRSLGRRANRCGYLCELSFAGSR